MGDKIYVPYQEAESEFVEKRSRFIGRVWPVDSEEQAQELIRRVKKQHYDARHNCWCYLLGSTVVRYSPCWRCSSGRTSPTRCAW